MKRRTSTTDVKSRVTYVGKENCISELSKARLVFAKASKRHFLQGYFKEIVPTSRFDRLRNEGNATPCLDSVVHT